MKGCVMGIACVLGMVSGAGAVEKADSPWQQQTHSWLQLQAQGRQASTKPQAVTPAEQERILQRWLDSYKHEIPDFFEQKKGGATQSGG